MKDMRMEVNKLRLGLREQSVLPVTRTHTHIHTHTHTHIHRLRSSKGNLSVIHQDVRHRSHIGWKQCSHTLTYTFTSLPNPTAHTCAVTAADTQAGQMWAMSEGVHIHTHRHTHRHLRDYLQMLCRANFDLMPQVITHTHTHTHTKS